MTGIGIIVMFSQLSIHDSNALSFYATKTVLVGPKWFWSDQIDLDLTIMIWSRPKWNCQDQNELVRSKLWFSTKINHIWTWPFYFGRDQIIMVRPKPFWTDQNFFGHIEGQGINLQMRLKTCLHNIWMGPNGPKKIKTHPTSWQYPLINYFRPWYMYKNFWLFSNSKSVVRGMPP